MLRLIALLSLAGSLGGCASSPFSQAPAAQVGPTVNRNTPPGATGANANQECVTDEGYGRYLPCGYAVSN